jgi:hypothetical protein
MRVPEMPYEIQLIHPQRSGIPPEEEHDDLRKAGYTFVGLVRREASEDWAALAILERGRDRSLAMVYADQVIDLPLEVAGEAFFYALGEACEALWQHNWNAVLGTLFGLNRRTLQRDRVAQYLLPARVTETLSYILSADDAAELSLLLQAIVAYKKRFGDRRVVERYVEGGLTLFYDDYGPGGGFKRS